MSNQTQHQSTTLVLGSTGKTGRRVAERLRSRGMEVREGSRTAEPPFDWDDRTTWERAVRGMTAVYVVFYPDLAVPGAAEKIGEFARRAVDGGVQRLVLLSGRGEPEAQRAERALQDAGADWTIVRCSWFSQNFSESFFLEPLLDGQLALPADSIAEPFVDAEDIADVAVAALTQDGHAGQVYELTGPRLLRFDEAVAEIARASGREIAYVPVTIEQYGAAMAEQDVPGDIAWLASYLFTEVLDGRNAQLADGVQRALGREPRDFRDYARRTAASGAWGARAPVTS